MWSNQAPDTITIPPGAGPGTARVIIDSSGIHVYDAGNVLTFDVNPLYTSLQLLTSLPTHQTALKLTDALIQLQAATSGSAHSVDWLFGQDAGANGIFQGTDSGIARSGTNPDTFKFGIGPAGGYYYEEVTFNQSVANGASPVLTGLSLVKANRDYNAAWNLASGVWTCPVDSIYVVTVAPLGWSPATYQASVRLRQNGTTVAGIGSNVTAAPAYAVMAPQTIQKYFFAGDTFDVLVFQNSGAAQTINGFMSIRRQL